MQKIWFYIFGCALAFLQATVLVRGGNSQSDGVFTQITKRCQAEQCSRNENVSRKKFLQMVPASRLRQFTAHRIYLDIAPPTQNITTPTIHRMGKPKQKNKKQSIAFPTLPPLPTDKVKKLFTDLKKKYTFRTPSEILSAKLKQHQLELQLEYKNQLDLFSKLVAQQNIAFKCHKLGLKSESDPECRPKSNLLKRVSNSGEILHQEPNDPKDDKPGRQGIIPVPYERETAFGVYGIYFSLFLLNAVMAPIHLGLNIANRASTSRLDGIQQEQLDALGALAGIPPQLLNPALDDDDGPGGGVGNRNDISSAETGSASSEPESAQQNIGQNQGIRPARIGSSLLNSYYDEMNNFQLSLNTILNKSWRDAEIFMSSWKSKSTPEKVLASIPIMLFWGGVLLGISVFGVHGVVLLPLALLSIVVYYNHNQNFLMKRRAKLMKKQLKHPEGSHLALHHLNRGISKYGIVRESSEESSELSG